MWAKQPDVYVTMSLLSVPVESNLKCQAFNSLFHIYTVLRPRALFSPECAGEVREARAVEEAG